MIVKPGGGLTAVGAGVGEAVGSSVGVAVGDCGGTAECMSHELRMISEILGLRLTAVGEGVGAGVGSSVGLAVGLCQRAQKVQVSQKKTFKSPLHSMCQHNRLLPARA
jgi:hypothetical protein